MKYLNAFSNANNLSRIIVNIVICVCLSYSLKAQPYSLNVKISVGGKSWFDEYNSLLTREECQERISNTHKQNDKGVFNLLPEEMNLKNIPICIYSYFPNSANKSINSAFVLTDIDGISKIKFSDDDHQYIWIDANGGRNGRKSRELNTLVCETNVKPYLREEYEGEGIAIDSWQVNARRSRGEELVVPMNLNYSGILLETKKRIEDLLDNAINIELGSIIQSFNGIIDSQTVFGKEYPLSAKLIRINFLTRIEQTKQGIAIVAFKVKRFEDAIKTFDQLLNVFPKSPNSSQYISLRDSCVGMINRNVAKDSLEKECNNILDKASSISDHLKAIKFLKSHLLSIATSDPCSEAISQKIESLQNQIQLDEEQAENNRQKSEDEKALKKYKVDDEFNQIDLFKNPFGLRGKYIAIQCAVVKFETPNSAIMDGGQQFFADFKVTPPKKFKALYLIVKVNGVKTLVNAFGTPIKVPYVDVVHILNALPNE